MLAMTMNASLRCQAIKTSSLKMKTVIVDTTVAPKAIAHLDRYPIAGEIQKAPGQGGLRAWTGTSPQLQSGLPEAGVKCEYYAQDRDRAIVAAQHPWRTMQADRPAQHVNHLLGSDAARDINDQTFTCVLLNDRQALQLLLIGAGVRPRFWRPPPGNDTTKTPGAYAAAS